jgi:hypothetical protein
MSMEFIAKVVPGYCRCHRERKHVMQTHRVPPLLLLLATVRLQTLSVPLYLAFSCQLSLTLTVVSFLYGKRLEIFARTWRPNHSLCHMHLCRFMLIYLLSLYHVLVCRRGVQRFTGPAGRVTRSWWSACWLKALTSRRRVM